MERKIILLITKLSFMVLLTTVRGDECGNRCTSTQICGDNGTCHEKSNLISCTSFTSIFNRHYCLKTQDCCDDGCMPKGSVCCRFSSFFCERGHSCCSIIGCCPPGTFCKGFSCIDDIFSTQKPTTASPPSTLKPRTTTQPKTRYPPRTQRSPQSDSNSELKPWVYAVIVIVVIVVISVVVVVALLIRRRQNTTSNAQSGRKGFVLNAPQQMYGQAIRSNGVPIQTSKPPQQVKVAYIATKPVAPIPAIVTNKKNKKQQLFSL